MRSMVIHKTIGKTGTYLGRQRFPSFMLRNENGRMPVWEKKIVSQARDTGLVSKELSVDEALVIIDAKVDEIIDLIDSNSAKMKIALSISVLKSLSVNNDLPEIVREKSVEAQKFLDQAINLN